MVAVKSPINVVTWEIGATMAALPLELFELELAALDAETAALTSPEVNFLSSDLEEVLEVVWLDCCLEVDDSLTEVEVAPFLQTNESPLISPFFCKAFKALQEKLLDLDSTSAPPLTDFKEFKSKTVKLPMTSRVPPMVVRLLKPSIFCKCVLLAMTRAPPMVVKLEKDKFFNSLLETMLKVWPTVFSLVKFKLEMELLMKPNEELIFFKLAKEAECTSVKLILFAQTRSSKMIFVWLPLNENCRASVTASTGDLIEVSSLLLFTLKTLTFFKTENPSTDCSDVSEM